jgi:hypothetical protein
MGYLDELRIGIIWRNDCGDGFGCSDLIKVLLSEFFPEIKEW